MGDKTGIEWADATWNPVTGCTKVSPGCKHCYAERHWARLSAPGQPYAGRKFTDVALHRERLEQPLRWLRPRRIFVNSMSDLFHEDVPDEFIWRVFMVMREAARHTFQVLTKRPVRMYQFLFDHWPQIADFPLENVWLGVSVENQQTAEERIPVLLDTPAAVRFVSLEPLLEQVRLAGIRVSTSRPYPVYLNAFTGLHHTTWIDDKVPKPRPALDWLIVGCESGPKRRPMNPEWVRALIRECGLYRKPLFVKQVEIDSRVNHNPDEWPLWMRQRHYPAAVVL